MTQPGAEDPELQRAILEFREGVRVEANGRLLFDRYYPWLRRFFRRLGYTLPDCEDLAQSALAQMFHQIGSFRSDSPFPAWLFAIASNLHRNEQRRRHREKRSGHEVSLDETSESGAPLYEPRAPEAPPSRAAYEKERREAVARVMKILPPQMRRAITLRIEQDLKYREIAAVLQISVETVKAHLFSARQRLREELGEEYGDWLD